MTIDPKISEYIDFAIARQGKISDAKFETVLAKWDAKFEAERVAWDIKFNKERDISYTRWDAKFNEERDKSNAKWDAKFEAGRVAWDIKFNEERDKSNAKWDAKFKEDREASDVKWDAKFKEDREASDAKWDAKFKEDRDIARADSERHMGMLLEQFQDRLQLVKEWVKDLPTRDEVRTMIQDETNPIRRDIAMFKIELINLRRESDLRLTRLEHKIA
jgi:hypothetical protein